MVDLVKIRKKAREKKERDAAEAAASAAAKPVDEAAPRDLSGGQTAPGPIEKKETVVQRRAGRKRPASRLDRFKEEVLQRQALAGGEGELSPALPESGDEFEILTFLIGPEQFALAVSDIAEIVEPRRITRIPNAPPGVLGIVSLRGTIVTILDVSSRLGLRAAASGPDSRLLIVEEEAGRSGFIVDRIGRVTAISRSEIRQEPTLISAEQSGRIRGVCRREGELIMLLNLDRVLQDER